MTTHTATVLDVGDAAGHIIVVLEGADYEFCPGDELRTVGATFRVVGSAFLPHEAYEAGRRMVSVHRIEGSTDLEPGATVEIERQSDK